MDSINDNVIVKVSLNLDDYIQANRVFLKKRLITMSTFYFIFGSFLGIYPAIRNGQEIVPSMILQGLVIGIALGALASFIEVTTIKFKSKKVFESNNYMTKENEYSFKSEGIGVKAEAGTGQIPWANVSKLLENKSALYVFTSKRKALIIPKREFKDEGELNLLRDLIKENMMR